MIIERGLGENFRREMQGRVIYQIRQILQDRDFSGIADLAINGLFDECVNDGKPLTDALRSKKRNGTDVNLPVNTYPYGKPTDEIFSTMLAVCDKKSDFVNTLRMLATHGLAYGGNPLKEIILLTSVWDTKEFREVFEEIMLLLREREIKISIILVTDYGAHEVA